MGFHQVLHRCYLRLARRRPIVRAAVLVRNQLDHIVRYGFAESYDHAKNGESLLLQQLKGSATRFVDVGANVGEWSSLAFQTFGKEAEGILVEPSAQALGQLENLFGRNPRVRLVAAAAADVEGAATFFQEPNCGRRSSLVKSSQVPGTVAKTVRLTTIDAELQSQAWDWVDMVKIDAEGYDSKVLHGMSQALQEQRAGLIQFEYNYPWLNVGATLDNATSLLTGCGYSVFLLRSDGLYELNYRRYGEWFSYANFVAVSPQKARVIRPLLRGRFD